MIDPAIGRRTEPRQARDVLIEGQDSLLRVRVALRERELRNDRPAGRRLSLASWSRLRGRGGLLRRARGVVLDIKLGL